MLADTLCNCVNYRKFPKVEFLIKRSEYCTSRKEKNKFSSSFFPMAQQKFTTNLCACYSTPSCELSLLIWPVSRADNMEWDADIDVPVATAGSWSPMVSTWVYVVTRLWCDVDTRSCEVIIVAGLLEDRTLRWDSSGLTSCRFMYGDPSEFWTVNMVIGHSNSSRVDSVGVGGPVTDKRFSS